MKSLRLGVATLLALAATGTAADLALSAENRGIAVCLRGGPREQVVAVPDGAGGAIVVWQEGWTGSYDIYMHHVLSDGTLDQSIPPDGRPLCAAAGWQTAPSVVSDGAGGAIVTWADDRNGASDIYALRFSASGEPAPGWGGAGLLVCAAGNPQLQPTIASDMAGGAIVSWHDERSSNWDIYAQRVLASGVVDPNWPTNGRGVCVAPGHQVGPRVVSDGTGGALIVWQDPRAGTNDIFASHVLPGGTVDHPSGASGSPICSSWK